jgi:hypothetical protein
MFPHLDPFANEIVQSAVVITGSGRSGTTILGKLLHTYSNVEYAFEPSMLVGLFPLLDHLSEHTWKYLYEVYLAEEFLANTLAGRSINTNRYDDSSIYVVKSSEELEQRLSQSWPKREIFKKAKGKIIAYKIPDIVSSMPHLLKYYPKTRVIIMTRGAPETINSLIQKQWFDDSSSQAATIWPFKVTNDGKRIPYWVLKQDEQLWLELSEIDRCAYYYLRMNESAHYAPQILHVRYSEFVSQPTVVADRIAQRLGLVPGEMTQSVLSTIKPTREAADSKIMQSISEVYRSAVIEQSALTE